MIHHYKTLHPPGLALDFGLDRDLSGIVANRQADCPTGAADHLLGVHPFADMSGARARCGHRRPGVRRLPSRGGVIRSNALLTQAAGASLSD